MERIRSIRRAALMFAAPLVIGVCVACTGPTGIADLADEQPVVATSHGPVQGFVPIDGVWAWKGIPFAAPPLGELRWRTPRDPEPWQKPIHAVESADKCTQWGLARPGERIPEVVGSEDCLYIDVYRPRTEDVGLPVFFWIHGGANNNGDAATYDGSRIATEMGVVVVVIQYRLGPFGWFRHSALRDGEDPLDDSGNFGTLDQIKALEWVRDNVTAFGADPTRVTIAGESAGAHNVTNLLVSPRATGLFHRAISQSGGMMLIDLSETLPTPTGDARSEVTVATLLDGADAPDDLVAYLRSRSAAEVLKARTTGDGGSMTGHSAYIDGTVIPGRLQASILEGHFNKVPVIVGANESESRFFLPLMGPGYTRNGFDNRWGKLHDLFDPESDPDHEWTFEEIFPTELDRELYDVSARYGSRNWRAKYMDEVARPLREMQPEVYAYLFKFGERDIGPTHFDFVFGAAHAMEIPFFFGADRSLFGYSFTEANAGGREALQSAMMAYLGRFIHTGDPNGVVDLPGWPGGFDKVPVWQPWSNDDGTVKAIFFDADLDRALIEMTTEEDTTDQVLADLEAELASWDRETREKYGWVPRSFLW